jgi:hypothetical protein
MKETYTHIDELLRRRLAEVPVLPYSATGWDALECELDVVVDAPLRKALIADVIVAAPASGWVALERELDALADAPLREALTADMSAMAPATGWAVLKRKLDPRPVAEQSLADKLTALVPALPTGWDMLSARMDRENAEGVDVIVAAGLNTSTGGNVSGWAALAARLELIGWRRSTLAAWKITEGALLMSLLLLLVRFGPAVPVFANIGPGFPLQLEAPATDSAALRAKRRTLNDVPALPATATRLTATVMAVPVAVRPTASVLLAAAAVVEKREVWPTVSAGATLTAPVDIVPTRINGLVIEPLQRQTILPSPMVSLPEIHKSEPVYYYINTFLSPLDVNQVITRNKEFSEVAVEGGRRFTNGLSGGFLMDFSQGKNAIQIGIILAHRSYDPTPLDWKSDQPDLEGYQRFNYTSIELPFNYKRVLHQTNNWRFSGRVGMSMNVIASSRFKGEEDVYKSVEIVQDGPQFRPLPAGDLYGWSEKRQFIMPEKGWLEGGSIFANSSFYLGGGLVVERLMTPRWSLYLSPSFGRVIYLNESRGIGPTNDRIHSGSLRMGSRYLFGGGGEQ